MYFKRCNISNFNSVAGRKKEAIKYIVVHYTANNGDTARNNVDYFARASVGASAHYFVDDIEVACSVPWDCVAWHCGGNVVNQFGGSVHGKCTNYNSIGVEMCSRRDSAGAYFFTDDTIMNCAAFVARLMREYGIDIDHVVRHYDVTGKNCPAPFVHPTTWRAFKELVEKLHKRGEGSEMDMTFYYEKIDEIPEGELRNTVADLVKRGIVKGNGSGLHLSPDMVRCLVFCNRMVNAE